MMPTLRSQKGKKSSTHRQNPSTSQERMDSAATGEVGAVMQHSTTDDDRQTGPPPRADSPHSVDTSQVAGSVNPALPEGPVAQGDLSRPADRTAAAYPSHSAGPPAPADPARPAGTAAPAVFVHPADPSYAPPLAAPVGAPLTADDLIRLETTDEPSIRTRAKATILASKKLIAGIDEKIENVARRAPSKKSTRSVRLAQARDKLLELEIQRAKNEILQLEAEDSEVEELESVESEHERHRRISNWLDSSEPAPLAIKDRPHEDPTTDTATGVPDAAGQQHRTEHGFTPVVQQAIGVQQQAGGVQLQASHIEQQLAQIRQQVTNIQTQAATIQRRATHAQQQQFAPAHPQTSLAFGLQQQLPSSAPPQFYPPANQQQQFTPAPPQQQNPLAYSQQQLPSSAPPQQQPPTNPQQQFTPAYPQRQSQPVQQQQLPPTYLFKQSPATHVQPQPTQPTQQQPSSAQRPQLSAQPVPQQPPQPATFYATPPPPSHGNVVATQGQQLDISQLASAIAFAARSGQPSRMFTDLPIYTGNYQEWLSFRAAFIETAASYSDVENLARLRKCLRGRAKESVETLLLYNTKPEEIMRTLESRFGRPDAIALAELDRLRALPRPSDAPRELCVFATKVANIVATLRVLDKVHYLYNPEITKSTIEKLTPTMRYRWFDFAADQRTEEPDLLKLTRFLEREAERCGPFAQPENIQSATPRKPSTEVNKTYAVTEQNKQKEQKTQRPDCLICEKTGHTAAECKRFLALSTDDRWDAAKSKSLCFRCLKRRNQVHRCPRKECNTDGCDRLHHALLHFVKKETEKPKEEPANVGVVTSTWVPRTVQSAFLKILPVKVTGPQGEVDTFALLDDGSTVSLLDEQIATEIGAEGPVEPLRIEAISTDMKEGRSRRVRVTLQGTENESVIAARTVKNLKLSSQRVSEQDIANCEHLKDIAPQIVYNEATPKILIGQDNWHLLVATDMKKGQSNQPVASKTHLGWVLHGTSTRTLGAKIGYVNHMTTQDSMDEQLKEFFAIESLLITPKKPMNDPEKRALDILEATTKQRADGHYEVGLLWNKDDVKMPDNKMNALKRLDSVERKIHKSEELKHKYEEQMDNLIQKKYAEPAPTESQPGRTWYLPHFPVINVMKPGKVRVVHDAAAKTMGVSLNDHLLTGPDLLQSLPGILMRFRQHKIAITADIREMFMQVKIREEDRDALRYLWRDQQHREKPPIEYRMTSLIFGATSSPATAIYVKNINAKKYEAEHPEASAAIVRNHYVDDYLHSFPTEEKAISVSKQVDKIQKEARYELRQWCSNSPRVLEEMGMNSEQKQIVGLDLNQPTERVLGIEWDPRMDHLKFNLNLARLPPDIFSQKPTKRTILKVVMSLFDPLGFASPITARAKQLLQEIWRRGTGWDEPIEEDLIVVWQDWTQHLNRLSSLQIPRCHPNFSDADKLELHTFVDASEAAYAAVVYWRTTSPAGDVSVSLVVAKARVAPLKLTSVPRLELQAAVMGSRMAASVIEEHDRKPDAKVFWTDSRTVLAWLKTGSRAYRPFVAHRIAAIEENSKVDEWRWVPTKHNVADDATREVPANFDVTHRWFNGPAFLHEDSSQWPKDTSLPVLSTGEEKTHHLRETEDTASSLPDSRRFSRWERLLRATARVLQFIQLLRSRKHICLYKRTKKNVEKDPTWTRTKKTQKTSTKQQYKQPSSHSYLKIEADLLKEAELRLLKASQQESFKQEIHSINSGTAVSKDSRLRALAVEVKDGILRLKSRISEAAGVTEDMKTPMILDGKHNTVKLYIEYVHRKLHHSGVESVVNECRQKYHIIGLRPAVRLIVRGCIPCRMKRIKPTEPPTGNHPLTRLAHHQRAFSYVGVDYFGPLTVTVGRTRQKRYVALFTCLTTRAVHLEIAASLTTDSAIMALRRMIARRGCPTEIWSDNGTNLVGADKELRRAIDAATEEEAAHRLISWRFIPPSAPFMGGVWERLVRSVKEGLYATLTERYPTEEVLATLLAEVEFTVNNRPLTHVSVDPEDPAALTPNHFLLGGPALSPAPGTFTDSDLANRSHWRASQRLADIFWHRWVREYLPDLQNRREPHGRGPPVKIGDVVLIVDNNLPRNTWPKGVITAVFPGPDNIVRTVDVRTKGGVIRRPVKKLVVLPTEATVLPTEEECDDAATRRHTAGECSGQTS